MLEQVLTKNLWPTQIRVFRVNKSDEWNRELVEIVDDFVATKMKHYPQSGFKHTLPINVLTHYKTPAVAELFGMVKWAFWKYMGECAGITASEITPPTVNMFANREGRGQWSIPHTHHGNQCVITYYPRVDRSPDEPHPYAGYLAFHNPTPSMPSYWARKWYLYSQIPTETGTLVCFPGNAEHSTFPFFEQASCKWALVSNWRFAPVYEGGASSYELLNAIDGYQKA